MLFEMKKVLQSIFVLVCCCSDIFGVLNYLIELHDLPNCFLDVDTHDKIIYNCNGGLRFSLVNGNPGVLFKSATGNEQYICHQGFVPYLLPLGGNEHTFYIVNNNDNYAMVRSKDYPTRYLWQNDLTFLFENNKETATTTKYKFIVCDFNIQEIISVTKSSVNITIDARLSVWNISKIFVIKCEDPNNITNLYNFTGSSTLVTSLHGYSVYKFSAGFQNEFGFYVFGNISYYLTDEDVPSAYPDNFIVLPTNFSSLLLSWGSVNFLRRNGIITKYQYSCNSTNGVILNTVDNKTFYITVNKLQSDTIYNCSVAACTRLGCGVPGFASTKTPESFIYLIEPYGLPNCYLNLFPASSLVTYNCNDGLTFLLMSGVDGNQGSVSFQYAHNQKYLRHYYVLFLETLTDRSNDLGDRSFYVKSSNYDSYFLLFSSNFPSYVVWRDNNQFAISTSKSLVPESSFKLRVYDLKIIKIFSVTSCSVNITIETYLLNLNISNFFLIKCKDPNNITSLYNFTGNTAYITSLHSYTLYEFYPGLKNGFGIYAFGNVSYYLTDEAVPAGFPVNFTVITLSYTSLLLSWNNVEYLLRNGIILNFVYSCKSIDIGNFNTVSNNTFSVIVSDLKSDTNYTCGVAACNKVGCGVQAFAYNKTAENFLIEFCIHGSAERNILTLSIEIKGYGHNVTLEYYFPSFVELTPESDLLGFKKESTNPTKYFYSGYFENRDPNTHNLTLKVIQRVCIGNFPIEIPVKLSYMNMVGLLKMKQMVYQTTLPCFNKILPKISKDKNALPEYYGRGIYIDVDNSYVYVCMNQHAKSTQAACYYSNDFGNYWLDLDVSVGCVLGHHLKTKDLYAVHRSQKLYLFFHGVYKKWLALTNEEFKKIIPNNFKTENRKSLEQDEDQIYVLGENQWMGNAEGLFVRNGSSGLWTQRVTWSL